MTRASMKLVTLMDLYSTVSWKGMMKWVEMKDKTSLASKMRVSTTVARYSALN